MVFKVIYVLVVRCDCETQLTLNFVGTYDFTFCTNIQLCSFNQLHRSASNYSR